MWRFLVPIVFAAPLLWTAAEWRLVINGPADRGTGSQPATAAERCDLPPAGVDEADKGFKVWAAFALRIDDSNVAEEDNLSPPWRNLRDGTKGRVESLRAARGFSERYRAGGSTQPRDPDVYQRALEERKIDVELLKVWKDKKRVKDAEELKGHGQTLASSRAGEANADVVINAKSRAVLRRWLAVNKVLNATSKEKLLQELKDAKKSINGAPDEPPFADERVKAIKRSVEQLIEYEKMTNAEIWGLQNDARSALPYWREFETLMTELNGYEKQRRMNEGVQRINSLLNRAGKAKW